MRPAASVDNALFEALFTRGLDVSRALEAELKQLGYDRQRPEARYPGAVLVACLEAARRATYAGLPEAEGFQRLGRHFIEGFRETILGRVATAALPLFGPARFLPRLPGRLRSLRDDVVVTVEVTSPRTARLSFADPLPVAHFFAGVIAGALEVGGGSAPRVEVSGAPGGYVLLAQW